MSLIKKKIGRPKVLNNPSDITVSIEQKHSDFLSCYPNASEKIREALNLLMAKEEFNNA